MDYQALPGRLEGQVRIPASKSHTIRALLIASLAEGRSVLRGPLVSGDTLSCRRACEIFGARIHEEGSDWVVEGFGPELPRAVDVIDTGNSGTTLYLATSLAALGPTWTFFTGDHQIRRRPAENLLRALRDLGAQTFTALDNGCAPYAVRGPWKGGKTSIECPTSQYLSSLLLAAPLAREGVVTEIEVPLLYERPYAEMTLAWLREQGVVLEANSELSHFRLPGGQRYRAFDRPIAGDWSSATFFLVAPTLTGGEVVLEGLDPADTQGDKAVLGMLQSMGAQVQWLDGQSLRIGAPAGLEGRELDLNATPDALPALAVAGCYARGETRLVNVPQARLKETDRITVMARELTRLGAEVEERPDGLVIRQSRLHGGEVDSHGDHRVAMSLALAALGAEGPVLIRNAESAAVTFPGFFERLEELRR